jgi:hypothetical protein
MSTQTLDLTPDIELDIENELSGGGKAHALPFCTKHKGAEFFPAPGSIVETICGKLIRIKEFLGWKTPANRCAKCTDSKGKVYHCYYCGREVIGY